MKRSKWLLLIFIAFLLSSCNWLGNTEVFTVYFRPNGGSDVSPLRNVPASTLLTEPIPPTRDGYHFWGWFWDESLENRWTFSSHRITSDATLYAKWGITAQPKRTVQFETHAGETVEAITGIPYDSLITRPADPTKTGYDFDGWHTEHSYGTEWDFDTDTVTEDITLHAKWTNSTILHIHQVPNSGYRPGDQFTVDDAHGTVTWTSSDESVIDTSGKAVGLGSSTIKAVSASAESAEKTVTVNTLDGSNWEDIASYRNIEFKLGRYAATWWVDYNNNGVFEVYQNEKKIEDYGSYSISSNTITFYGNFPIPANRITDKNVPVVGAQFEIKTSAYMQATYAVTEKSNDPIFYR